jgi:hypothetical protein
MVGMHSVFATVVRTASVWIWSDSVRWSDRVSNTPSHTVCRRGSLLADVREEIRKILVPHEFMVGWWMMLGKIIGPVAFAGLPYEINLSLLDAVFNPMIPHVPGLGFFRFDKIFEYSMRG